MISRSVKRYVGASLIAIAVALPLLLVACGGEEVVEVVESSVEWGYSGAGAPEIGRRCRLTTSDARAGLSSRRSILRVMRRGVRPRSRSLIGERLNR